MLSFKKSISGLSFLFLFFCLIITTASAQTINSEAKVSLTFDDGFLSTYTNALPILSQRSIPATEFVTTAFVDKGITDDGLAAMTWQQVQSLQNQYGWEIGSHTITHPELPTISVSQMRDEVTQSKTILEGKGLTISSLATPFGAYDNNTLIETLKIYNLERGFWDRDDLNSYPYDRSVIMVQSVETGVTFTQVKNWIDQAISQKKWLVLVFHEVQPSLNPNYEYTTTSQELTQIADYIKQTGIKVVRMDHTLQRPTNLLTNASFNDGLSGGWTTDTPAQMQEDNGTNGSFPSPSNSIRFIGATKLAHLYSPFVPVSASSQYAVQVFINANGLTQGQTGFVVDEYGEGGTILSSKTLGTVPAKTIKYFSTLYQPGSSSVTSVKIQTFLSANAQGTVYVDNYELSSLSGFTPTITPTSTPTLTPTPTIKPTVTPTTTPTPTPTSKPTATPTPSPTKTPTPTPTVKPTVTLTTTPTPTLSPSNLVSNPSFEQLTGSFATGWTKDGTNFTIDTTSKGNAGTNSIHLTPNTTYAHLFSSKMTVISGTTYIWQQYIKTVRAGGEFGFYIDEYDSNGNWISGVWKGMLSSSFTGTKQFSYKPSSTRVKSIGLQYYAVPKSTFDLYLDSVVVSK